MLLYNIYRLVYPQQHTIPYVLEPWLHTAFPWVQADGFRVKRIMLDRLQIEMQKADSSVYFSLEDIHGNVLPQRDTGISSYIDTKSLAPGWYILRSYTDKKTYTQQSPPLWLIKADDISYEYAPR